MELMHYWVVACKACGRLAAIPDYEVAARIAADHEQETQHEVTFYPIWRIECRRAT